MSSTIDKKSITITDKTVTVIGEVAVGIRPATDPEFKAAARILLTKFQNAPTLEIPLEAVTL
jgi:hypothetical protein